MYANIFHIKMPLFLLRLIILSFIRPFPVILLLLMSSEIFWSVVFLLLVGCATILWFFLYNAKKRRRPHKKEIFICGDCWLLVFDFLEPSQLGLEIALVNRRFDFYVDKHFKTRKWKLNNKLLIQLDIDENGTKQMKIVKSDGNTLPIPRNPLPSKIIGLRGIQILYIDLNVIAFLRRFRRIFAICAIDLDISTENVRILDYFLLNIWPMLHDTIHVLMLNTVIFRHLRQLAPSMLNDCPSLHCVSFNDAIFPTFPPDESANASDGQAVVKWLFTPRPDGMPKWLKFSVNSPDQWSSTIEQLKTAFSNASSPVTFRIFLRFSSTLIDAVVPFDLINEMTVEKLALEQYGTDGFVLSRCPIGWDEMKWRNVQDELLNDDPQNPIHFLIRDGGLDEGLVLDAASPGPSGQQ